MELRLPLIVASQGRRLFEAFVPGIAGSSRIGPSLSELRDEVALAVMEHCSSAEDAAPIAELSLAPHHKLRTIEVETVAFDEKTRKRVPLSGAVPLLVEQWPHDDFVLVTPTREPRARFAVAHEGELREALARRLAAYCIEHGLDSLSAFSSGHKERVEVLEVDVDPPSILPVPVAKAARPASRDKDPEDARRRARLSATTLRTVARNWSHAAADGLLEPAFGREALVQSLLDAVDGAQGTALVLVGPTGAGKTAVVRELVRRLRERCEAQGRRRDVWRVDANRFIAGMSVVGQWEARARSLVSELRATGDLLYVDDLAALAHAGRTSKARSNLAQFLAEPLSRGDFSVLAECSPEALERLREDEPAFARLFRVVRVAPMSERESVPVVLAAARAFDGGAHGPVSDGDEGGPPIARALGPDALEAILAAAKRYWSYEALPGSAVRLLRAVLDDETVARVRDDGAAATRITAREVLEVVGRRTGLPPFVLGLEPPRTRERVVRELSAMVAAQPEAIDAATDAVLAVQAGLGDPDKPVATFLFVGPTGVGKTETAKALAAYLYGSSQRLLRFDMSEFQTRASVARLVGDAWRPDGELTGALRSQPFRVVLFDEVEKAHPAVFDALLRMLGEGRVCDAAGRPSDARACVIVMTSNLGVREASARAGFLRNDPEEARRHYVRTAELFFRPEFFNRIDRVVAFRSLDRGALRVIVRNALSELLSRRGVRRGNVLVDVEPKLLDLLVEQAFDPRYGARPLRRALERRLAVPLAYHLVRRQGDDVALVHALERDGDMALAVRLLREAPSVFVEDTANWDDRAMRNAFESVDAALDELTESAWVKELEARRSSGLAVFGRTGTAPVSARSAIELLDRLEACRAEVSELATDDLSTLQFEEEELPGEESRRRRWNAPRSSRYAQSTFVEVPILQSARALLERNRPRVAALADEVAILELQIRSAAERGDERATLFLEPVLPTPERVDEWAPLAHAIPTFGALTTLWREERAKGGEPGEYKPVGPLYARRGAGHGEGFRPGARHAISLEGPALSAMLARYDGYALISWVDPSDAVQLVRMTFVPLPMPDAAEAHRLRQREARDALRAKPESAGEGEPPVIVLRTQGERLVHVATGLGAEAREAIIAALQRS
ncbi:MAG: ATP-dependent Clp protease ATP-binding subunit [Myxococcales bacterium]|nr:ATP-dependent Clp protease ATP-binding subunit [Myxococcales bacterium]